MSQMIGNDKWCHVLCIDSFGFKSSRFFTRLQIFHFLCGHLVLRPFTKTGLVFAQCDLPKRVNDLPILYVK